MRTFLAFAILLPAVLAGEGSKKPGDIKWNITIDPYTADTVADAAWNCIHDFAKVEPKWVCNPTNKIIEKYRDMCSPEDTAWNFRAIVFKFCARRAKEGRIPPKLPYLNKTFANDTKINVDLDIDIDFNNIQVVDEDGTPITNYQDVIVAITDQPDVLKINATTISLSSSTRLATASPIADMLSIEVPPSTTRKASASTTFTSKTLGESLLIQTLSDDVRADMISLTGTRTTISLSTSVPTASATWKDGDPITSAAYETPDDPLTSSSLFGSNADTILVQAQQDTHNVESQATVADLSLTTSIAQPSTFKTVRTISTKLRNATATVTKTITISASASGNALGHNSTPNLSVEQDVAIESGNKSGSDETTEADHIKIQIVQPCVKVICDSGTCLDPIECDESGVDA